MSRIAWQPRENLPLQPRRYMTKAEKLARWEEVGRCCVICRKPCEPFGPTVIWDHFIQLVIGGTNDLDRMDPHHVQCAKGKTKDDAKVRGHVNRLRKIEAGEKKAPKHKIQSRGFSKAHRPFRSKR